MIKLIITDDEGRKTAVPFVRDEITIGRAVGNTIRLTERNISRQHIKLEREEDEVFVEDLDSYNGTLLNGNRIARRTHFFSGDFLEIGDFEIELEKSNEIPLDKVEIEQEMLQDIHNFVSERMDTGESSADMMQMREDTVATAKVPISEKVQEKKAEAVREPASAPRPSSGSSDATKNEVDLLSKDPQRSKTSVKATPKSQPAKEVKVEQPKPEVEVQVPDESVPAFAATSTPEPKEIRSEIPESEDVSISAESVQIISSSGDLEKDHEYQESLLLNSDLPSKESAGEKKFIYFGAVALLLIFGAFIVWVNGDKKPAKLEAPNKIEIRQAESEIEEVKEQHRIDEVLEDPEPKLLELPPQGLELPSQDEIDMTLAKARRLMQDLKWRGSEKLLNKLLARAPKERSAISLRDESRREKGNMSSYNTGLKAWKKKNYLAVVLNMGQIGQKSYYYPKAKKIYKLAAKKLVAEYIKDGWDKYSAKDYSGALSLADMALELDKNNKDAKDLREKSQSKKEAASEQSQDDPLNAKQHYRTGSSLFQSKRYDEAIEHFRSAIKLDPQYSLAFRALGASYASLGDMDKAMLAYRKYIKLSPDAPDATQVKKMLKQYQSQGSSK